MEKIDIKSLDYAELQNFFESLGEKSFRAKQVYQWIHEKLANGFDEMTSLPKSLRDRLSAICGSGRGADFTDRRNAKVFVPPGRRQCGGKCADEI